MNYLEFSKLLSDALLFLSLCWLAWRFAKAPGAGINTSRIAELDASLRSLLREADDSSRNLSGQLLKRQKDLEKVLYDIETAEHRVNKMVASAEERKSLLDVSISKADSTARSLDAQIARAERFPNAAINTDKRSALGQQVQVARQELTEEEPSAAEVVEMEYPVFEAFRESASIQEEVEIAPEPPSFENNRSHLQQQPSGRSLAQQVEREVAAQSRAAGQLNQEIRGIYRAAEKALKAGQVPRMQAPRPEPALEVEHVPPAGAEPIDVSGKNQSIISSAPAQPGRDPRLGVLGGIKRQVQIV